MPRVKAAHTGDQGRTLGVIAMEIQNLSVDARNRTEPKWPGF